MVDITKRSRSKVAEQQHMSARTTLSSSTHTTLWEREVALNNSAHRDGDPRRDGPSRIDLGTDSSWSDAPEHHALRQEQRRGGG